MHQSFQSIWIINTNRFSLLQPFLRLVPPGSNFSFKPIYFIFIILLFIIQLRFIFHHKHHIII